MCFSLAACTPKELESEWQYDKETAEALLLEFEQIAEIPRQTGSCDAISDYMAGRLEALGFYTECDAYGNLIAEIPASEGLENKPLVILQSNMDMVCAPIYSLGTDLALVDAEGNFIESEDEGYIDMSYDPLTDGINTVYNDGMLRAIDTALGAKSGMAMSILLKYLSGEAKHGPLRIILTVDGFDSFSGANALDEKYLEGASYLINLNGGNSNNIYTSSAGEKTIVVMNEAPKGETVDASKLDICVALRVKGLIGGNAADNLADDRLNAGAVLLELVQKLTDENVNFGVSSLYGGSGTDNIISDATAILMVEESKLDDIWNIVSEEADKYRSSYAETEQGFELTMVETNTVESVLSKSELEKALSFASKIQLGVLENGVKLNLGSLLLAPGRIAFRMLALGSESESFEAKALEIKSLADEYEYSAEITSRADIWTGNAKNKLKELCIDKYKELDGGSLSEAFFSTGLEPSVFAGKSGLDIVSIGPDVWDSGTVEEFCNLESAVKVLNLLESVLPEIN